MVVAAGRPFVVAEDQHDRHAAVVAGLGPGGLVPIEARQGEFQRRLGCQAAGLEIQHPVEHRRLVAAEHGVEVVGRGKAVGRADQLLFEPTGDLAAGVVVRRLGDAQPAGPLQQGIAGKGVSHRGVIMLALGDDVQAAVLADAEVAQARKRRQGRLGGLAEGPRAGPRPAGRPGATTCWPVCGSSWCRRRWSDSGQNSIASWARAARPPGPLP